MSGEIIRVPMGKANAYLIPGKKGYLLVDAGAPGSFGVLERVLIKRGSALSDIKGVVITHGHYDHVGALAEVKKRSGSLIAVHRVEADWLRQGDCVLPKSTSKAAEVISSFAGSLMNLSSKFDPVEPDREVDAEISLDTLFGNPGIDGRVIPVPGHTAGSLAVVAGDRCCVGDTLFHLFPGKIYPPFADDPKELLRSWQVLLDTGCRFFHPGHGAAIRRELLEKEFRNRRT